MCSLWVWKGHILNDTHRRSHWGVGTGAAGVCVCAWGGEKYKIALRAHFLTYVPFTHRKSLCKNTTCFLSFLITCFYVPIKLRFLLVICSRWYSSYAMTAKLLKRWTGGSSEATMFIMLLTLWQGCSSHFLSARLVSLKEPLKGCAAKKPAQLQP